MNHTRFDAVVLAGGRGSRLGGVDKATITLGGERLVDRAVAAVRAAGAEAIVVVGPGHTGGEGVAVVREDPPFGGPLAALAAALPRLRSDWVLLLSCDLVRPDRVCEVLTAQNEFRAGGIEADGFVLRDFEGREQWLAGCYRVSSLRSAARSLGTEFENAPLRRLLAGLTLRWISAPPEVTADIDEPEDLTRAKTMNHTKGEHQ